MNVAGRHYRTIWPLGEGVPEGVGVIDQSRLPHEFVTAELRSLEDAARAISTMVVRGAPLIGATAAYGVALAMRADASDAQLDHAARVLQATRPTAHNLAWALGHMRATLSGQPPAERVESAFREAARLCDADVAQCRAIGAHGLALIREAHRAHGAERPVQILTHCNAGWLACVDWGTALAPVYLAHDAGIPVHVWVDETRPRNQGAALTAFELGAHGVPHTVIVDNLGGHLMQQGRVDLVIVGSDRTTASGDVCNKVGTYLKALAAHDNGVPFYVALPSSTLDWSLEHGADIPIEERSPDEVTHVVGRTGGGALATVRVVPEGSAALNLAFDVTPARLVSGLITERGVCAASAAGLDTLYPERHKRRDAPDPAAAASPATAPTPQIPPSTAGATSVAGLAAASRSDAALREAVISALRELTRRGLSHGTSGNVSVRRDAHTFFISPTGMAYDALRATDIPLMDTEGHWFGCRRPSSEWRFHRDILRARPEAGAILHCHAPAATALACTGRGIPAFHYMVAVAGGADIRCAPYFTFGTQELSDAAVAALTGRRACLLANHGLIALGADLPAALALAGEVENLAAQYRAALALGAVHLLDDAQMREVLVKFSSYGQQSAQDPDLQFAGEPLPAPPGVHG
ncbi:MAG TPA: S-methyl-5-thioribose-1-phosphate isomerase [Steroidobacteraceae bacterium]